MKLDSRQPGRQKKSVDVLGKERAPLVRDSREAVKERWGQIFADLVDQFSTLNVESIGTLPRVIDLFDESRDELIESLRQAVGPERFTYEHLKPMLDKISFGEDEAFMSGSGLEDTKKFMANIKKPKAVVLKLLFPAHAEEVLNVVKGAIDDLLSRPKPFDFPSPYIEAMRLDPERADVIRKILKKQKKTMISAKVEHAKRSGVTMNHHTLETLADLAILFPEERTAILQELKPTLEVIRQQLSKGRLWGEVLFKARALEILFHGARLTSDGIFKIDFPKTMPKSPELPERLGV